MGKKKKAKIKDKPKMKRRTALSICFRLWDWLWSNPEKRKHEWPEWEKNDGKVDNMDQDCPSCEYDELRMNTIQGEYDDNCSYCPLKGGWGGNTKKSRNDCMGKGSHFRGWNSSKSDHDRKKYAGKIRNACVRELRKYKGNEKFGKLVR